MRADFALKLGVAQNNRSETAIYFPHNIDFRGRAYTMHPNLSHLGSDLCRGLLKFAQTRPLGEHGLKWLRIQVANVYGGGVDKLPLDKREQFIIDNMQLISDSATNPLRGERWWLQAEDPWQCLAGCMELHKACQHQDPHEFESSLPVHQDGSCNGLQHYAALARDEEGGRAVNLLPSDAPQDVYKCAHFCCPGFPCRLLSLIFTTFSCALQGDRRSSQRCCHEGHVLRLAAGACRESPLPLLCMTFLALFRSPPRPHGWWSTSTASL